MSVRRLTTTLFVAFGCVHFACSVNEADSAPTWIHLARGFVPRANSSAEDVRTHSWSGGELTLTSSETPGTLQCDVVLAKARWTNEGAQMWSAVLPVPSLTSTSDSISRVNSLRDGELDVVEFTRQELERVLYGLRLDESHERMLELTHGKEPRFAVVANRVYLRWTASNQPPHSMKLRYSIQQGREVDGAWRVLHEDLAAEGISVLPGRAEIVDVQIPAASALRFRTTALVSADGEREPMRFAIQLNSAPLYTVEHAASALSECQEHVVLLPEKGLEHATLSFEVHGPFALAAFLQPIIGPAEVGDYNARPWIDERPDIVLLLGDTYRADNLAAWGGDPALAPHLNLFAAESRRYLAARAPATATMPSQAAMFSGLHPPQCGVRSGEHELASEAYTLTEYLRDAGYRTIAITDSGFVSWQYGFGQGFESFEQSWNSEFEPTLDLLARHLAADDGRPLFLFVQSYRSHNPYLISDATRARLDDDYPLDGHDFDSLLGQVLIARQRGVRGAPLPATADKSIERFQNLYRGSSADLDEGFGDVLAQLRNVGFLDHGVVVYTSDHGEAFGAHGVLGHGAGVWDDQALVPLCLRAPGVEVGDDATPVSLLDLAPTLARLAGLPTHASWAGRDLLSDAPVAPIFTFTGTNDEELYELAVVVGERKLIFDAVKGLGPLKHAYDLSQDRGEERDERESAWAAQLSQQLAEPASDAFRNFFSARTPELSRTLHDRLHSLGYAGSKAEEDED